MIASTTTATTVVTALREARAAETGATIIFSSSMKAKTITLSGTQLKITQTITVDAPALYDAKNNAQGLTINADGKSRVFHISGGTADSLDLSGWRGEPRRREPFPYKRTRPVARRTTNRKPFTGVC